MDRKRLEVLAYNAMTLMADGSYTQIAYEGEEDVIDIVSESYDIDSNIVSEIFYGNDAPADMSNEDLETLAYGVMTDVEDDWTSHKSFKDEMGMSDEEWAEYKAQ